MPFAVLTSLFAGTSAHGANLVIDDFSNPGTAPDAFCSFLGYGQCVYRQIAGNSEDIQSPLTGVFGDSRQLNISGVDGQQSNFGIVSAGGIASLANATGVASVSILTYDGSGNGLNINENAYGGFDSFDVEIPSADLGFDVTLRLTDGSGTTASETLFDIGGGSNVATTASFDLNAGDFLNLDFTDIDVVVLELFGDTDLDAAIDLVSFIGGSTPPPVGTPEPATMLGLLAVGAMGFASRRRQK